MKKMRKCPRLLAAVLSLGILCTSVVMPSAAEAPTLTLDKTEFMQGEEITAHYTGTSGKDWIAIYNEGDQPGGPWAQVYEYTSKTGQPDGTMDFKDPDRGDVSTLAPGNYTMYLLKDDGYEILDEVPFVISQAEPSISTDRQIYPKGETPVFSYTGSTHQDAWIGIYPADNNTPGNGNDSLVYKYTRESGQPSGTTDMAEADGITTIDQLPAGEYYAYLFADGGYDIVATCTFTLTDEETVPTLSTDKESYGEGETPVFSYTGSTHPDAWIGIYPASRRTPGGDNLALIYKYTRESGQPDGTTDLKEADGTTTIDKLPSGEYYAYLFADGGYTIVATCTFTLNNGIAAPSITSDKAVYTGGDQVSFYYTGSTHQDAWIGIYPADRPTPGADNPSLIYKYTRESGQPNGTTDLKEADGTTTIDQLPAGEYYAYLFLDGGYTIVATCTFAIQNRDPEECDPPKEVTYNRTATERGYADGSVTITPPDDTEGLTGYALFWGDENGVFEDYAEIPVEASGSKQLNNNTMIPSGATRLYAFAVYDGRTLSPDSAYAELPAGIAAVEEEPLYSFQVFSDTHLQSDPNHLHNQHLRMALADIEKTDPDSIAIFNVGDVADTGAVEQYRQYNEIVNSFSGIPYIYCTPGNHDLKGSDYNKEIGDFLEGTNAPSTYYSEKIGDATFIMLGSQIVEPADCHAQLNDDQLEFLKAELAKASDGMNPIFVFLHQPLYNTVSGTLPGQNWDGIYQDQELREIFKQYPQVIFITGHTHWELDSKSPMYAGNGVDANMFNDASVGYLWKDDNTGKEGSQGYYVEVYANKVLVRGRDFVNAKWIPNAQFIVDLSENIIGLTAQISQEEEGLVSRMDQVEALLDDIRSLPEEKAEAYASQQETLTKLQAKAEELSEEAQAVKEAIDGLPAAGEVTLEDEAAVNQALEAYDALTDEQKELVGQEAGDKLSALEEAIQALKDEPENPGEDPGEDPGENPGDQPGDQPEDPDPSQPEEPSDPSDEGQTGSDNEEDTPPANTPDDHDNSTPNTQPDQNGSGGDPAADGGSGSDAVPQTGDAAGSLAAAGALLAASAGGLFIVRKRKKA